MKRLQCLGLTLALVCGPAFSNQCIQDLAGKSYECAFGFPAEGEVAGIMTFVNSMNPDVFTPLEAVVNANGPALLACNCMPKGKPSKPKTNKNRDFICIEADGSPNVLVLTGRVAGKGKKIVKGRVMQNANNTFDRGVFRCRQIPAP